MGESDDLMIIDTPIAKPVCSAFPSSLSLAIDEIRETLRTAQVQLADAAAPASSTKSADDSLLVSGAPAFLSSLSPRDIFESGANVASPRIISVGGYTSASFCSLLYVIKLITMFSRTISSCAGLCS